MITPDANILLYAYNKADVKQPRASRWLEEQLSNLEVFALNWHAITAFIRISTNPSSFPHPFTLSEAADIVNEWLTAENTVVIAPTARHWPIFWRLLIKGQAIGPLAMDAHLAALAIE